MLPPTLVHEVRVLLAQGRLSQRTIARQLGVSRGAVKAISLGKRAGAARRGAHPADAATDADPLERCPGCGGMVKMPCLLCHARWMRETRRHAADSDSAPG